MKAASRASLLFAMRFRVVLAIIAMSPCVGCSLGTPVASGRVDHSDQPSPSAESEEGTTPAPLKDLLAKLAVKDEIPGGYKRDSFPTWVDADDDGCNTREEVLLSQALAQPAIRGVCDLSGGTWFSEYDGLKIDDSADVDVDHVVGLAEAWASGAHGWTMYKRELFANDLGVPWALIVVSAAINRAKGGSDPAEWLPPRRAGICPYIAAWIGVKVRWDLSVDDAEQQALTDLTGDCTYTRINVPAAPSP